VQGYRSGGRVLLFHDRFYRVGVLSHDWERIHPEVRAVAFYDQSSQSTIATNAFCRETFEDAQRADLISSMTGGISRLKILHEEELELDDRTALKRHMSGELDGVPIELEHVLVKKNNCMFDFVAISEVPMTDKVQTDFASFYQSFHYE